jgi:hypothetical protein
MQTANSPFSERQFLFFPFFSFFLLLPDCVCLLKDSLTVSVFSNFVPTSLVGTGLRPVSAAAVALLLLP